jgi:hypothetical protein
LASQKLAAITIPPLFRRSKFRRSKTTTDVTSFHVAFEEKWQRDFKSLADAGEWAQAVSSSTGRMTWVVERWERNGLAGCRLRAAFPEERREEAGKIWLQSTPFPPPPSSN